MLTISEIKKQIELGNIEISDTNSNSFDKPNSVMVSIGNYLYELGNDVIDTKFAGEYVDRINTEYDNKENITIIPEEGLLLKADKVYLTKIKQRVKTKGFTPALHSRTKLSLLGISIEINSGYYYDNFDGNIMISIKCSKPTIIYPNIEVGNLSFFRSNDIRSKKIGMLSGEEIKSRMDNDIIITPTTNILINPNSVNLTLNNVIGYYVNDILDINKENEIEYITIPDEGMVLKPNTVYLGRTNEWTETNNLIPMISGRSSLGRTGGRISTSTFGLGSIGFKGHWHFSLKFTNPTKILPTMKCCQIYYFTPDGDINTLYEGSRQEIKYEK